MQPGEELLQKWDERATRLHPSIEISSDGLVLSAGTILSKMAQEEHGAPKLALADEWRTALRGGRWGAEEADS